MRALIALIIVFSVLALAGATWLFLNRPAGTVTNLSDDWLNAMGEPEHPVSEAQARDALRRRGMQFPLLELPDSTGELITIGNPADEAMVEVVISTIAECPCSLESQPFFNELAAHYTERARFVGIIQAAREDAAAYRRDMRVPYLMAWTEGTEPFEQLEIAQSVYVFVSDEQRTIQMVWPGYDARMLIEMDQLLSSMTGLPPANLDLSRAPDRMTSGCFFLGVPAYISE